MRFKNSVLCSLGCPLYLPLLHLLLRISAAPIIGRMGFLFFRQLTVAACWYGRCISFFRIVLVKVADPAPQTTGRLRAVYLNMAELVAVMALRKSILNFIGSYPDCDVAKAWDPGIFF
jgi:hypothetical protein